MIPLSKRKNITSISGPLTVGQLIRQKREELKMTQSELGSALGYRYGNFIGYLENGKAVFPLEKWEEYADVLQVPKHLFLKVLLRERFPNMLHFISFHNDDRLMDETPETDQHRAETER